MKNKGFTLVELLAVIAILAILVIIAMPNVLGMFNNAKKDAFLTEVKAVYKSTKEKYLSMSMSNSKVSKITSSQDPRLSLDGRDLEYCIQLDRKGGVLSISVSNGEYYVALGAVSDIENLDTDVVKEGGFEKVSCNYLAARIFSDNNIQSDVNIDYSKPSSLSNGQGFYRDYKTGDGNNFFFRGGTFCAYPNYELEPAYSTGGYCTAAGGEWITYSSSNDECLHGKCMECSLDTDRNKCKSLGYEFYDLKNYVKFAGKLWNIVRLDENGEIRMILADSIGKSPFNSAATDVDNAHVGYMFGKIGSDNYNDTHSNIYDSTIKTYLDNWYETNIAGYANYLVDAGYCNDRTIIDGVSLGYGKNETYYASHTRNMKTFTPSYVCADAQRNLFTTQNAKFGNKMLQYPIGLLTYDEAAFAGMFYNKPNYENYLTFGANYWTMTPHKILNSKVYGYNWYIYTDGSPYFMRLYSNIVVRPVITIHQDLEIDSGSGTYDDPYVITATSV